MSFVFILVGVSMFYMMLFFFDSVFKSCMHYPYFAFLQGTGLKIGILNFSWTTTAFNRSINKWSKNANSLFKKWFKYGYVFTVLVFLPISLWILFQTVVTYFGDSNIDTGTHILTPVIPGVNIPSSDFWPYVFSIGMCTFFHELGHAIAAVQEDVQLISFGFVVVLMFPIAFVQINRDNLSLLSETRKLRILCAGVWHNVVIALIAYLLVDISPFLFNFGYITGFGVKVEEISRNSPLLGKRGLKVGDILVAINECDIKYTHDYAMCLFTTNLENYGYCLSKEFISQYDESQALTYINDVVNCCDETDKTSLCFENMNLNPEMNILEQYSCLKPRDIINRESKHCYESESYSCPVYSMCFKPCLANNTQLHNIERLNYENVLYIGYPHDIYDTITVTHYIPRNSFFSMFSPDTFEKAMTYMYSISLGLAFLNTIPCYKFDGHHIAKTIVQLYANFFRKDIHFVNIGTICIVTVGTMCTVPTILMMFYKTIMAFS